jgi:puromycin-sensitive aminopeptidase
MELDRYRLPRTVEPSRYDLTIEPDLEAATFTGSVDVALTVNEPVTTIVLNAAELEIVEGSGTLRGGGRQVEVADVSMDEELQRATLMLTGTLPPGAWQLRLEFNGTLNDRLHGFYRSRYTDEETGDIHVIAATQFEAADARRAFPCWDEPDRKAVFGVTLVVPDGLTAVSNGQEVERRPLDGGRVRIRFADTMRQSTYLVAFVVGRLEVTEPVDADGVPMRILHVPGRGRLTGFALDAGAFAMRFFREYYGIPYPAAKMDFIALPDFAAGAMENTGCITYRESLLLVDPATATQPELEGIADVVAHELAHQWFGNLVTMRWWNGIWLNEAFATFMALLTVDMWRPDWERFSSFARAFSVAKEVDSLRSTRPIEYPVASPDDTSGMFDVLTYQKGAAILRMLERYLGGERFRDGIRLYLKRHQFANTETHDLWDAIEHATGEPVRRIMDHWIWQGGYPLLTVSAEDGAARISQTRFLADGGSDTATWDVPLRVRELAGPERSELVRAAGASVDVSPGSAFLGNAAAGSFVRVRYADDLLERLLSRPTELTGLERYGLVDDLWASVVAGAAPVSDFFRFARRFGDEDDLAVWQALLLGFGWCDRFLDGEHREAYRRFVRTLVTPAMDRLGWEPRDGESDRVHALRGALFQGLGILGADPNAGGLAREFEAEGRAGKPIDPALAAASVNIVALTGSSEDHQRFAEAAREMPTPQEQLRYLHALPMFRGVPEFERTLEWTLEPGEIRTQNAPFVLALATTNRDLGGRAWSFIKGHWDEAQSLFPPPLIIRLVEGVRYLTRQEDVEDAAAFFVHHPIPQSAKNLEQMLERQRIAAALRARATPELETFFAG